MKPLYLSYGSHYTLQYLGQVVQAFFRTNTNSVRRLERELGELFDGSAVCLYNARQGIEIALRMIEETIPSPANSSSKNLVFTQAFSCFALEEAIVRAGWKPAYIDIASGSTTIDLGSITAGVEKYGLPQAILVQNTLGIAPDLTQISSWCRQNEVVLIEDLAQSIGGEDSQGQPLGSFGEFVVCSFGRDKIIDAVAGGALIVRSQKFAPGLVEQWREGVGKHPVPRGLQLRTLFFAFLLWKIRVSTPFIIGKVLFQLAKRLGLLVSPIESQLKEPHRIPAVQAELVLLQLKHISAKLAHRRSIARVYWQHLADFVPENIPSAQLLHATWLRFPIVVNQLPEVVAQLKKHGYHLSDRWYRAAVDCGSLECESVYVEGTAPEAEKLAQRCLNLPTHDLVSTQRAEELAQVLKTILETNDRT